MMKRPLLELAEEMERRAEAYEASFRLHDAVVLRAADAVILKLRSHLDYPSSVTMHEVLTALIEYEAACEDKP